MKRLTALLGIALLGIGCKEEISGPARAGMEWLAWAWSEGYIRDGINYGMAAWNTARCVLYTLSDWTGADPLVLLGGALLGVSFGRRAWSLTALARRLLPKREVSTVVKRIVASMGEVNGWQDAGGKIYNNRAFYRFEYPRYLHIGTDGANPMTIELASHEQRLMRRAADKLRAELAARERQQNERKALAILDDSDKPIGEELQELRKAMGMCEPTPPPKQKIKAAAIKSNGISAVS